MSIPPEPENRSLIQNQLQFALGAAANYFLTNAAGPPVPWTGLLFNTITSFKPFVPWKREDPLTPSRMTLMFMLRHTPDVLPEPMQAQRKSIYLSLDHAFFNQNRYWPSQSQRHEIIQRNRQWLVGENR